MMWFPNLPISPVAVAIFDYEALAEPGEEDNLEFEEGDLIQVHTNQVGKCGIHGAIRWAGP